MQWTRANATNHSFRQDAFFASYTISVVLTSCFFSQSVNSMEKSPVFWKELAREGANRMGHSASTLDGLAKELV